MDEPQPRSIVKFGINHLLIRRKRCICVYDSSGWASVMEFPVCTASVSRRFRLETHRGYLAAIVDLEVRVRLPNLLSLSVLRFSVATRCSTRFLHLFFIGCIWRTFGGPCISKEVTRKCISSTSRRPYV